jgi:hypothetical protein
MHHRYPFDMWKTVRCVCALTALLLTYNEASAKGGNVGSEAPYNPQHIQSLPPNIRNHVMGMCRTPRALHTFPSYDENLQRVVLHFEHFYCEDGRSFCGPFGCLHQVYVFTRGHYKLLRSYYAPTGD